MPKTAAPPRRPPRAADPPPPVPLPVLGVDEPPRRFRMTRTQYHAFEEAQTDSKFEWVDGEAIEMTGVTEEHSDVAGNICFHLRLALRGRPFKLHQSDMAVHAAGGPDRYPDVVVAPADSVFEPHPRGKRLRLSNPIVLVEVLSEWTTRTDTVLKREEYLRIPSVSDYLIAEQDAPLVTHHRRDGDQWRTRTPRGTDAVIALAGVGVELSLADVYEGVLP